MTQEDVANILGISVTAYRELERGGTSIMNPHIMRMAELMQTTTEKLVLGYEPVQSASCSLEEIEEEYGHKMYILEQRVESLEKLTTSLEETIASKNEIISMLKKMLAEQK
jgi:transcriptional regulator with XRE-family HTH domain